MSLTYKLGKLFILWYINHFRDEFQESLKRDKNNVKALMRESKCYQLLGDPAAASRFVPFSMSQIRWIDSQSKLSYLIIWLSFEYQEYKTLFWFSIEYFRSLASVRAIDPNHSELLRETKAVESLQNYITEGHKVCRCKLRNKYSNIISRWIVWSNCLVKWISECGVW